MRIKSIKITLLIILLIGGKSFAQQRLSLEECRELAIQNNKEIQIATQQERVAYYNKKEALSKFFPEISFAGTYIHNQKNLNLISSSAIPSSIPMPDLSGLGIPLPPTLPPAGTPIDISDTRQKILDMGKIEIRNLWAGGFSLTQPIFMGGQIVAYNDLRGYAQELAETMKDTKLTEVIVEIDNTYWQVVSLANKKKLAESYVNLLRKMDSDISAMEREGVATKADRLTVSVKLNEAEMTLTKAANGVSLSKMLLCQLCGIEIGDNIVLADEDIQSLDVEQDTNVLPDVNEALTSREEIKSLELATKIYEKQEKIAMAGFMPNVAFTANYIWTNPNLFDGFEKKFDGMWNVGVVAKVPLNFWSTSSKYKSAKAETVIKRLELADAREKITLEVNQSAYKLTEAHKKLTAAEKNVEKADENLRYANIGFEEGVIPTSDALSAHTAWISAHAELIDAQIDVKLSRIYLNKALGRKIQ